MPLQSKINQYYALGVPGMPGDTNVVDYHPNTLIAEADITVGTAVWRGTDPATQAKYGGTGAPLGFVERNIVYAYCNFNEEGTPVIITGETLTIMVRGCMWVAPTAAVTVGQAVIAATADGTVTGGAAGDAGDTGWIFETAAEAGEVALIKRS